MNSRDVDRKAFDDYYRECKQEVDDHIDTVLDQEEEFEDLRRLLDLAAQGGKRVRPTLTMLMADATNCPKERALMHAAIVELLHNATLIADDWADDDDFRRDLPAVWRVLYGIADRGPDWVTSLSDTIPEETNPRTLTVLASHNMQAITLQLVHDPAVQRAMGKGVQHVFKGFYLEGKNLDDGVWTGGYDKYVETSRYKTGGFFALSTWMPAIIAPGGRKVEEAARTYGESLGILYQVADDIADDDLPDLVKDPEAELEKWYERAVSDLVDLPICEGDDEYVLLKTAPAWACHRMFEQEDVELEPAFLADLRETATTEPTE